MKVMLRWPRFPISPLALGICLLAGICPVLSSLASSPVAPKHPIAKLERLQQAFRHDRFVAYTPSEYDPREGFKKPASEVGIRADLQILRPYFDALVTYSCNAEDGMDSIVPEAARLNFHVVLGIWDVTSVREIETAVSLARQYPKTVIAVIVGNETQLFRRADWKGLEAAIRLVQAALPDVPVSTSEPISSYGNRFLRRTVDFHAPNCHWIFQSSEKDKVDTSAAVAWLKERVESLQEIPDGDKPVLIKEHGLPSEPAPFTPELQVQYWKHWMAAKPNSEKCASVFFEYCDLPWMKAQTGQEYEAHWGAWSDQRHPKPVVDILSRFR